MRALSIQSTVVFGTVGNKAAVLPLQLHGIEVDTINVVQFSNHTGYKCFKGWRMSGEQFDEVVSGLRENNFLDMYDVVLLGYLGDSVCENVVRFVAELRQRRGDRLLVVCDTVCGDDGKCYVGAKTVETYRESFLQLADIVTPNGFEASLLSGTCVHSVESAKEAALWFHRRGPRVVVITSFYADDEDTAAAGQLRKLLVLASVVTGAAGGGGGATPTVLLCRIPALPESYSGTGDTFASLFTAFYSSGAAPAMPLPDRVKHALEHALAAVSAVLRATTEHSRLPLQNQQLAEAGPAATAGDVLPSSELRLVGCRAALVSPTIDDTFVATVI